jgi:hypothetical protein
VLSENGVYVVHRIRLVTEKPSAQHLRGRKPSTDETADEMTDETAERAAKGVVPAQSKNPVATAGGGGNRPSGRLADRGVV